MFMILFLCFLEEYKRLKIDEVNDWELTSECLNLIVSVYGYIFTQKLTWQKKRL